MKKAFLIVIVLFLISCKKDDPSPSVSNNNNPIDTTNNNGDDCGELYLSITYKGLIHTAHLPNGLYFLNQEIQLPFQFSTCDTADAKWIYDSIYTHSSGNQLSPVITRTYFNSWENDLPKKFEVGLTGGNPSTSSKYTFYFMLNGHRPYYEGEGIQIPDPNDPNASPLILGHASAYSNDQYTSYLQIDSMGLDNRKYDDTHTINEYSKEQYNNETYIVKGSFRVIRLINNELITGSFKTQMQVGL